MKISGLGSTGAASSKRSDKAKRGDGAFSRLLGGAARAEEAPSRAVDAPNAVAGLDSLLAMQSVDPDAGGGRGRQRLIRHGEELLDRLEDIRVGLLTGTIPKAHLADLAHMVRAKRDHAADPNLAAILDEIELRAEVELAKLMRRS